jgi:acyl-CoA dehydrogenase
VDLKLTEEQQAIADALKDFALNEIRPSARECEEAGEPSARIAKQLVEMGVATPVPLEFGGQGAFDAVTSVIVAEELGWGDPGIAFGTLAPGLAATLIDLVGSEEQRADLLPKLAGGALGSVALAERDAGADISRLDSAAQLKGEVAHLSGTKYAVPAFDMAQVRLVVTGSDGGLGLWLIPEDIELVAKPEDKLGLRSARTFKVLLDGVEVPANYVIEGPEPDQQKLELALLRAKLLNAGIALGLARASFEYASNYARERTAFGLPIGAFQGISFKIADRSIDIDAARLLVWKAAWAVDEAREDADRLVFAACAHAIAAAVDSADDGVQILGGHGYVRDHPVELWYRDAMTLATLDSPSMIGDLYLARAHEAGAPTSPRASMPAPSEAPIPDLLQTIRGKPQEEA